MANNYVPMTVEKPDKYKTAVSLPSKCKYPYNEPNENFYNRSTHPAKEHGPPG